MATFVADAAALVSFGIVADNDPDPLALFETPSVDIDVEFPLDDGKDAAVALANGLDAALLLCDEFNQLGLIHASLADTRLVTTPTLLPVLVRTDELTAAGLIIISLSRVDLLVDGSD